jgi:DMSO/TMAO reductase YedYZ molybdopterin-dependent catalytic subunit
MFRRKKNERLPPGQRAVGSILGWGTEHPGIIKNLPQIDRDDWSLTVDGEVENPLELDWEGFMALPQAESVSDFHCVEGWSVLDQRWEGVLFRTIVERVKPKAQAKFVWFECYDGYTTSLPLERLMDDDVIIAYKLNGEDLPQPLGGPMRLIVPKLYAYKSPMWLRRMTFMEEDRLGYWESGYYSNDADVWRESRYRR